MEEYTEKKGKLFDSDNIEARMHTAEHILFKALQQQVKDAKLEKINLASEESSFFVITSGLEMKHLIEAEKLANQIIKEDRAVTESFVEKSKVEALKELRIRVEKIKEDTVRVITVNDFDKSACSGNHVSHTGLIGGVLVTKFNALGKNKYEIRYKVDFQEEAFEFARIARLAKEASGTDYPLLVQFISNLKEENQKLKEKVRALSSQIEVKIEKEDIAGFKFYHAKFPGINKKQFVEKLNAVSDDNFIACFINEDETVTIAIRTNFLDANEILQELFKTVAGKGGGNKLLAQGTVESSEGIIEKIKELIK